MRKLAIALAVLILSFAVGFLWWRYSTSPKDSANTSVIHFTVTKGEQPREIAKNLKDQGLVRDSVAFFLVVRKLGIEKKIQAGSFRLSPSMSAEQIANKLTLGTEDLWITFPEGWRSEQMIEYLQNTNDVWKTEDAPLTSWKDAEGKLFPETYLVPKDASLSDIKKLLLETFSQKITPKMLEEAQKAGLTPNQLITIASLVEREAKHDVDRPLIAGVILNRLHEGMKLDIDATIQYAIGFTKKDGWWTKELTLEDLKFNSPFNTYLNPGLPPTPICNPGLAAINSVIYPTKSNYLYYVAGKDGVTHYAQTLTEHQQNIAKYLD